MQCVHTASHSVVTYPLGECEKFDYDEYDDDDEDDDDNDDDDDDDDVDDDDNDDDEDDEDDDEDDDDRSLRGKMCRKVSRGDRCRRLASCDGGFVVRPSTGCCPVCGEWGLCVC